MSTIRKGKYRNYKGHLYEVTGTARHSETLEDMVIYEALYGDFGIWVRPLKMFLEDIEVNGKTQKRFEFIENESSKEIHIETLKSDYKLFEATLDQVATFTTLFDFRQPDYIYLSMSAVISAGFNAGVTAIRSSNTKQSPS